MKPKFSTGLDYNKFSPLSDKDCVSINISPKIKTVALKTIVNLPGNGSCYWGSIHYGVVILVGVMIRNYTP